MKLQEKIDRSHFREAAGDSPVPSPETTGA
jgi:hypothetical protein